MTHNGASLCFGASGGITFTALLEALPVRAWAAG